jgi:hypothetical protein
MRLLVDESVFARTVRLLESHGYEVLEARQLGLSSKNDSEIARWAHENGCLVVTYTPGWPTESNEIPESACGLMVLDSASAEVGFIEETLLACLWFLQGIDMHRTIVMVGPNSELYRRALEDRAERRGARAV